MRPAVRLSIGSSVGVGGANRPNDVRAVQTLLNQYASAPKPPLKVDGIFGPKTRAAIMEFQRNTVRMPRPDGRIDPGQGTINALTGSGARAVGPPPRLAFEDSMRDELAKQNRSEEWEKFLNGVVAAAGAGSVKTFLGGLGRAEDARAVIRFYLQLRKWGHTPAQIRQCFQYVIKLPDRALAVRMFEETAKPMSKIGRMVSLASKTGAVVGFIGFLVAYIDHWRRGDYHMAFVEVYKVGMGKAIPWAGILEGSQALIGEFVPKDQKSQRFVKILRSFDPIGLGSVAVDTLGTFLSMLLSSNADDGQIFRLSKRMHEGPTRIFAEIGDEAGAALFEMSRWTPQQWEEALSWRSLFGFGRYLVTGRMPGE